MSSARRSADSGAWSGGLTITLLPAASGAADLPAANMNGWLNGTMRATTPSGSRTEKLTTSGPIGIDAPFISVTSPAKKSSCAAATFASLAISRTGLPPFAASIQRELVGVRAHERGDPPQDARALERRDRAPGLEPALRGGDRRVDVGAPATATAPSDSPVPGFERRLATTGSRRVPGAAVVQVAARGKLVAASSVPERSCGGAPVAAAEAPDQRVEPDRQHEQHDQERVHPRHVEQSRRPGSPGSRAPCSTAWSRRAACR